MNLRERVADYLTKGQLSATADLKKSYDTLKTSLRPGLGIYERAKDSEPRGLYNLAYYFEQECSIFSDIVLTIRQEVFRNGITWKPAWARKCLSCGETYEEEVEACECGSTAFSEPDKAQLKLFERADGSTFLEKANDNGQNLVTVLGSHCSHVTVADNVYLLAIKSYVYGPDGGILMGSPKEILAVDPREMAKIYGPDGKPGGQVWVCPEHRDRTFKPEEKARRCPTCNLKLQEAFFSTTGQKKIYYLKDEVHHYSEYYPSILYGYPPILKALDEVRTYAYIEWRTATYYERGRPPGILAVPTNNPEGMKKVWADTLIELRKDPQYVPWLNFDPQGKAAQFIKLLEDPGPGMLAVKAEVRERMGSRFGVSMVFLADTSTSGGLNQEGLMITISNRTFQSRQAGYNKAVFPWLVKQFNITDWKLELEPSEEQDEMAEKQRFQLDAQNAQMMLNMGFEVKFENNKFTFSGEAKPAGATPSPFPFGAPTPEKPAPEGSPADLHRSAKSESAGKVIELATPDEFEHLTKDELVKSWADDALNAIAQGALYSFYEDVAQSDIPVIHSIISEAFRKREFSLARMIKDITAATDLTPEKAEVIARTESASIANKAREIGWERMEEERGEKFLYRWSVHHDARTSDICLEIEKRVGDGVPMDRLKEIIKEVSNEAIPGWSGWSQLVAHPNERSTPVRVV